MIKMGTVRWLSGLLRLGAAVVMCVAFLAVAGAREARAQGTTWYVTKAGDSATDGDLATHSGTLRFTLAHATSGDFVSFERFDVVADKIFAASPLVVPAGVAVGRMRSDPCGSYTTPLANIEAAHTGVNPVVDLRAGSTFRGINVASGYIAVRISGADVDVCGAGIGIEYDGDGAPTTMPPWAAALVIDGPRAWVHRGLINGHIIVSTLGSDSVIGDSLATAEEGNVGACGNQGKCPTSILADVTTAAQRVTIREPFPRALVGMVGSGVPGGDDVPNHANNWAQTPAILSARSFDNFNTVEVSGIANPLSLVDIFYDDGVTITRQTPVVANIAGAFTFSGALPGKAVQVFVISTLNDPAHPNRVGSSSQLSAPMAVTASSPFVPRLQVSTAISNTTAPARTAARIGDVLRFSVTMTNTGVVNVVQIGGNSLSVPAGLSVVPGSGTVQGGAGFVATDAGFTSGGLTSGNAATYTLDLEVTAGATRGRAAVTLMVGASGVEPAPAAAQAKIAAPSLWLPVTWR